MFPRPKYFSQGLLGDALLAFLVNSPSRALFQHGAPAVRTAEWEAVKNFFRLPHCETEVDHLLA